MAADEITYSAPIEARVYPGSTKLAPRLIEIDLDEPALRVRFDGDNGVRITAEWTGTDGTALIQQLNTANLSTKSLKRRLVERALADGKIPAGGTVS